ncbi:MAG: hypothetical protein CVT99_01145 [Bacteroidetes bacterium HGW-Bacteroidetes-16]|nr:MAG: hypothetical protein CVT99_01145 [Bacteroidetes bacterium HGW-Bacteroidetes-16]
MKTDLDLRPIYHKKDENTMHTCQAGAPGSAGYWIVNTVCHQLKQEAIHSGWREVGHTMNTKKQSQIGSKHP